MDEIEFSPIPITILTGFLGAGKTTLLNNILHANHGLRVAVLVNDFGAINIDSELILGIEGETISLTNGCICCTIRDDLFTALVQLIARPDRPEYVIVETSGVSDPLAVVQTFLMPELRPFLRVDSILTIIDCEEVLYLKGSDAILALDQIACADMVVLNKVDLVDGEKLKTIRRAVIKETPNARIIETTYGKIPFELVLGVGNFEIEQQMTRPPKEIHVHDSGHHNHEEHPDHEEHHHHDHSLLYTTWSYVSDRPIYIHSLRELLNGLPTSIYRAKGFVYLVEVPSKKVLVQVVGRRVQITVSDAWGDTPPQTRIVMIAQADRTDWQALSDAFGECEMTRLSSDDFDIDEEDLIVFVREFEE